jgi:hypothetical protein
MASSSPASPAFAAIYLLMSLRDGPSEPDRPVWPTPAGEVEALARAHGRVAQAAASTGPTTAGVEWCPWGPPRRSRRSNCSRLNELAVAGLSGFRLVI